MINLHLLNFMKLNFQKTRILVAGDVMLDTYWTGLVDRVSPEAPVPVVRIKNEDVKIGGAGNVALNCSALGAAVHLVGLAGDDTNADHLERLLDKNNVRRGLVRFPGMTTISKLRILSQNQQLMRLDYEDNFTAECSQPLINNFIDEVPNSDLVILSDYNKGSLHDPARLIRASREAGKSILVDPKGRDFSRYANSTLLTPNLNEFQAVVGVCSSAVELIERGMALLNALNLEYLLITRSEQGMTLLSRNHEPFNLSAQAKEVFDVTGAGDTVIATLGVAMASGMSIHDSVTLANKAAGLVVSKVGTATISIHELTQTRDNINHGSNSKLCQLEPLMSQMHTCRENGQIIVMTNGCFDLLHPGHIDYLEKARQLGDRLIVAINDDNSIRRLKGPTRPVNPLSTRMRLLAALECVDWVIPFSEDTPEDLCRSLLPDILVKGGDYEEHQVAGADLVKSAGGRVVIIDFSEGHSTTDLIRKIQESSKIL